MIITEQLYKDLFEDYPKKDRIIALESLKQTLKQLPEGTNEQEILIGLACYRTLNKKCPLLNGRKQAIEAKFKQVLPELAEQYQTIVEVSQEYAARISRNISQAHRARRESLK